MALSAARKHVAFDPDLNRVLGGAFDLACATAAREERAISPWTREVLAQRIIQMAQLGERDPDQLCEDAMRYLARFVPAAPLGPQHGL